MDGAGAGESPVRIMIADDHEVVREGLRLFLSEEAGITVVGDAADGEAALSLAASLHPDVILMDISMPRIDGIEATRRIRAAGKDAPQVIILTSFADDERVREAIRAGAIAYLMKDVGRTDLLTAIHSAAAGQPTLHPTAQQFLMRQMAAPDPAAASAAAALQSLTDREREVLILVARGRSNKEIAAQLFLSLGTVKGYVSAVLAKVGVEDRTQATIWAIKNGLVEATDPTARSEKIHT